MSQYHVFLPPSVLSPLDSSPIPRLRFERLSDSVKTASGSQNAWSQTSFVVPHFAPVIDNRPPSTGTVTKRDLDENSRAASVKRSRGPLRKSQTEIAPDQSRRRSNRLQPRTSDGLLGTLPGPGLDTTESYLSLNTTVSDVDASQPFPPTADQSSLLNFPRWSIPLTKLTTLSALTRTRGKKEDGTICLIVCVLSVDQVVQRQRKEEKARGAEGTLWIGNWTVTAPPTDGGQAEEVGSCSVKLWDKAARDWDAEKVRRGDIVLLENIKFNRATSKDSAHIAISDHTRPNITVLYRTAPRYQSAHNDYGYAKRDQAGAKMLHEDRLLRPDLRLGRSDMGVRKVAEIARWFAQFIGIGEDGPA